MSFIKDRNKIYYLESLLFPAVFFLFLLILLLFFVLRFANGNPLIGVTVAQYPGTATVTGIYTGEYQKAWEKWLTDNFYGHTTFVKVHNQIEYSFFKDGIGIYMRGKDGYIYNKEQTFNYVGGGRVNFIDSNTFEDYAKSVRKLQDNLYQEGKAFLYLLTPIKAELYPEFLPWYHRILLNQYGGMEGNITDALLSAFDKYGVNYYDTTNDLKNLKKETGFDVYSKTGHHWTLTATAYEMEKIFDHISMVMPEFCRPDMQMKGVNNTLYWTDRDILSLQNVFYENLSDRYNSPNIEYHNMSNTSVYMFSTSFGQEIVDVLYQDQMKRAFNQLIWQEYFTNLSVYNQYGHITNAYTRANKESDLNIMNNIRDCDLLIMEQQGFLGIPDTHMNFIDYINQNFSKISYTLGQNAIVCTADDAGVLLEGFYDLEDWGRWSSGNTCKISLYGSKLKEEESDLQLYMNVVSWGCAHPTKIVFNDAVLDNIDFSPVWSEYYFSIPKELVKQDINTIEFDLEGRLYSPKEMGYEGGNYYLGLGIAQLSIGRGEIQ